MRYTRVYQSRLHIVQQAALQKYTQIFSLPGKKTPGRQREVSQNKVFWKIAQRLNR